MVVRRLLFPLLAAMLVIQGFVGAVPHQHGTAPVDGQELQAPSPNDVVHRCLACSVHAPAVDYSVGFSVATGLAAAAAVATDHPTSLPLSIVATSSPRGPPMGV